MVGDVCFAEVNSLQTAVDQSYVGTHTCRRLDGEARERWEALLLVMSISWY